MLWLTNSSLLLSCYLVVTSSAVKPTAHNSTVRMSKYSLLRHVSAYHLFLWNAMECDSQRVKASFSSRIHDILLQEPQGQALGKNSLLTGQLLTDKHLCIFSHYC